MESAIRCWSRQCRPPRPLRFWVSESIAIAENLKVEVCFFAGNNECFEPYTSNLYSRRTLSGEFVCINKHLLRDLISRGLWSTEMKNKIIAQNGSVQRILGANLECGFMPQWA